MHFMVDILCDNVMQIQKIWDVCLDGLGDEFNDKLYQQIVGTSMGSKPAPAYANILWQKPLTKYFMIYPNVCSTQ